MKAKPWQIAVVVLGAIVLAASIIWQAKGSSEVKFATEIEMADVETGELFLIDRGKNQTLPIPYTRPGADKPTLWPTIRENGKCLVAPRFREAITPDMGAVDKASGEVKLKDPTPQRIKG